jgi:actin-binding LIM protein
MSVMVDHLQSATPRPKSPKMNNEEPIEMSHYPDARKPGPNETPRIERDDFPAPPYPYADPERRRRYSESSKDGKEHHHHYHDHRHHSRDLPDAANSADGESEELSESLTSSSTYEDPQLRKEEEELSKIATGIGKVFLKEVREREKLRAWKSSHLDPRNSSRNPSAKKELHHRLRYDNPVNASPSRDLDRAKCWDDEDIEMMSAFRSSGGKTAYSMTTAHSHSGTVSSLRFTPRPGYGTRPVTPVGRSSSPASQRAMRPEDMGISKTHSIDFSSVRSDAGSSRYDDLHAGTDVLSQCMSNNLSGFYFDPGYYGSARGVAESAGGYRGHSSASFNAHFRRSMPNVNLHLHSNEPAKCYPYYMLMTSNHKLPPQIDRCHLEVSGIAASFLIVSCIFFLSPASFHIF